MINKMIATSVSLSRKMIDEGFDTNTADMIHYHLEGLDDFGNSSHVWLLEERDTAIEDEDVIETVFAWSLTRLIELLPWMVSNDDGVVYFLRIAKTKDDSYVVQYMNEEAEEMITYLRFTNRDLVGRVWMMLMELKKKGLI